MLIPFYPSTIPLFSQSPGKKRNDLNFKFHGMYEFLSDDQPDL